MTPVVADSSTEEGRRALFEACPDPDILAITIKPPDPNGDFLKVTPDMWRESIETTLIGPIEIMRLRLNNILPGMFQTEGMEELVPVYASAFGLPPERDVAMKHFRENNPIPAGFLGEPADMAGMAALLLSEHARFIVGQNVVIDGGQHAAIF